ncbi:MAG TPA: hypothetical protein VF527_02270 [Pyrinomonadaceae bacterium]|jgi:hypothetical protein
MVVTADMTVKEALNINEQMLGAFVWRAPPARVVHLLLPPACGRGGGRREGARDGRGSRVKFSSFGESPAAQINVSTKPA